jgi:hypothetical protein
MHEHSLSTTIQLQEALKALPLPEDEVRRCLQSIAEALLAEDIKRAHESVTHMEAWSSQCHNTLMQRLERQLRTHRPRIGVLEEDFRQKRCVELRNQHLNVKSFIDRQTDAATSWVCTSHWHNRLGMLPPRE